MSLSDSLVAALVEEDERAYWRRHGHRFPKPPIRGDYPTGVRWRRAVAGWFAAVDDVCAEIARELVRP